ncbi:MAG: PD40 domain-containing protein [Bacteroidaceae bacterium]|nr:PD40 domain-containing protein [Bacteroidaceae bacterium]
MKGKLLISMLCAMLAACSSRPTAVPTAFTPTADSADVYPDYSGVTVPPNIAPLNFMVADAQATEYVATIGDLVCGATADGKTDIDTTAWRQLLGAARGSDIAVTIYAHRADGWVQHPPFAIHVATDDIDPYLTYRLIEPGYELYRQLGIYQRDLTSFAETPVYENNRQYDDDENHCVNCHTFQAYDSQRTLFHVRAAHGGTVVTSGTEARKVAIRHDSILGAGVYPAWHPQLPLVAFSTNKTGQVFHMLHAEKIEVLDEASDLILYDAEANTVCNIMRTQSTLETFPTWSPDGKRLYYCAAAMPASLPADHNAMDLALRYDSLLYNIWSMPFDAATRRFGEPRLEVDAAAMGRSASVPRLSPDGRYLLFTLGDYGQFHIWHKSADLWLKDLAADSAATPATGDAPAAGLRPLDLNSPDAPDSYHTWSSNGRWIAFASRRDDGDFTRIYIAHFDSSGRTHKPFLLPQRDPEYNTLLLKSYNVPELARNPVRLTPRQLQHTVLDTEAQTATYIPHPPTENR